MKYLIAGLGNIGSEYELTRHNIGFLILDRLANNQKTDFEMNTLAYTCGIKYKSRSLYLIKPTTYMNLSGKAVNYYLQQLRIPKENLLVVTDDIALSYGNIRLKSRGSAGGHNGLKNIEQLTGGQNYSRLRFGVGDNFNEGRQVDYVLSNFSARELEELIVYMDQSIDAIHSFCSIGIEKTMSHFN